VAANAQQKIKTIKKQPKVMLPLVLTALNSKD
jgi:hypothetical protein